MTQLSHHLHFGFHQLSLQAVDPDLIHFHLLALEICLEFIEDGFDHGIRNTNGGRSGRMLHFNIEHNDQHHIRRRDNSRKLRIDFRADIRTRYRMHGFPGAFPIFQSGLDHFFGHPDLNRTEVAAHSIDIRTSRSPKKIIHKGKHETAFDDHQAESA